MPQYEPFQQLDDVELPGVPGLKVVLVKVGGKQPGVYVVMPPLCKQLGDLSPSGQVTKLRASGRFDDALREVPYRTESAGMRSAMGIRRHRAGDWIRDITPNKVQPQYRGRLVEIGKLITEVTDRAFFGRIAAHLDPAPGSALTLSPGGAPVELPTVGRLTFKGEFQFTCEHGTNYLLVVDEHGARVVVGREVGD